VAAELVAESGDESPPPTGPWSSTGTPSCGPGAGESELELADAVVDVDADDGLEDRRREYELYCETVLGCEPEDDECPFAPLTPEAEQALFAEIERGLLDELERRPARRLRLGGVVRRLVVRPMTRARGRRARRSSLRRSPARSPGRREPERPCSPPGTAA
jgi:hypothetical protein